MSRAARRGRPLLGGDLALILRAHLAFRLRFDREDDVDPCAAIARSCIDVCGTFLF